jgi:TLC domain
MASETWWWFWNPQQQQQNDNTLANITPLQELTTTLLQPYFIVPFLFWFACYLYCQLGSPTNKKQQQQRQAFHKWYTIHNIHNFGAILLGTISILGTPSTSSNSSSISHHHLYNTFERIPILWSLSYFTVDILDCTIRRDVSYLLHALCCFSLGCMNCTTPRLQYLKMNSKASYCEMSNPFMHLAKRTKQPLHFLSFAIMFTLCRIIWIPVMYYQLITFPYPDVHYDATNVTITTTTMAAAAATALPWHHPICMVLMAFYLLNVYWYSKIIRIVLQNRSTRSNTNAIQHKNDVSPHAATTSTTANMLAFESNKKLS